MVSDPPEGRQAHRRHDPRPLRRLAGAEATDARARAPLRAIAFNDIESIERKKTGMSPGAKVLLGVGVGIGALMFGVLLAFAAYTDQQSQVASRTQVASRQSTGNS